MTVSKPHQELFSRIEDAHHHLTKTDCDGCNAAAALIYDLEEQYEDVSEKLADALAAFEKQHVRHMEDARFYDGKISGLKEQLESLELRLRAALEALDFYYEHFGRPALGATAFFRPVQSPATDYWKAQDRVPDPPASNPATMSERTKVDAPLEGRGGRAIRGSSGESAVANPFDSEQAASVPNPASEFPTLDDRNPASVVGVPWNEDGYAGGDSNQESKP